MATIGQILSQVDENVPNAFSQQTKVDWISELDGKIAADVFLMGIGEIRQLRYRLPEDLKSEPLVSFPHDGIYALWLEARIHYQNGEADKYQNTMQLYNASYQNFVRWFARTYEPAQGYVT